MQRDQTCACVVCKACEAISDLVGFAFQLYVIGLHDFLNGSAHISQTCINSSLLNACSQNLSDHAPQKMKLEHQATDC